MSAYLQKNFKLGVLHLDNKVLFQLSSDQETLPLPTLSVNLRYYLGFTVVKDAMDAQLGAEITFNSEYYAPAYNPALGIFQVQNKEKYGAPYVDIFANFQWKKVTLFLKGVNIINALEPSNYFSAYHYIKPKFAFKVGIYWPFVIR